MTRRDDPNRLRKGREFVDYAVKQGCSLRQGNHPYVTAPNGKGCPIPCHPGDLPNGTRRSILRMFTAMGIAVLAALCAAPVLLALSS